MSNIPFLICLLKRKLKKNHFSKLRRQTAWHVNCGLLTPSGKDRWKIKEISRPGPEAALHRVLFTLVVIGTRPKSTALLPPGEPDSLWSFPCFMMMFHVCLISGVCLVSQLDFVFYLLLCYYLNLTSSCVWDRWVASRCEQKTLC